MDNDEPEKKALDDIENQPWFAGDEVEPDVPAHADLMEHVARAVERFTHDDYELWFAEPAPGAFMILVSFPSPADDDDDDDQDDDSNDDQDDDDDDDD